MGAWLKKHRLLIIAMILYVVVYFISAKYPAWREHYQVYKAVKGRMVDYYRDNDTAELLNIYLPHLLPNNRIIKKLPLDFLFYGIADIVAPVHFEVYYMAGLITYAVLLVDKVLKKLNKNNEAGKVEMFVVSYLIENVVFYPLAFAMRYFDPMLISAVDKVGMAGNGDISAAMKVVYFLMMFAIMLVLLIGFFLPSVVNIFSLFAYIIMLYPVRWMINTVTDPIMKGLNNLAGEIICAVIVIVLLLAYNLFFSFLLGKCQEVSIKPLKIMYERFMGGKKPDGTVPNPLCVGAGSDPNAVSYQQGVNYNSDPNAVPYQQGVNYNSDPNTVPYQQGMNYNNNNQNAAANSSDP